MSRALANPSVRINNVTIAIIPNSFTSNLGVGEVTTRVVSSGGNSVEPVHTVNAESKIGKMSFEVETSPSNIKAIQEWSAAVGRNAISAVEDLGDNGAITLSLTKASLNNDPDLNLSSDGNIMLEWSGAPIVVG